ncbi:MAG TPA: hypothetical protein VMU54_04305, partial [Planctomycetota bacterium]|nr:hypothetical protein [Planctomycetota bacterium]
MVALLLALFLAPQDDAAATEALTTFDSTFSKTKDVSARQAAISGLSKTHHEKVASRLGSLLTHDEKALRIAAAQVLATFNDTPELRRSASHTLTSALNAGSNLKEIEVQVAIFSAIGRLGDESSGTVLKSHFDDKDLQTAQAAIAAAGALKSKAMVEPLIEELRDCEKKSKVPDPPASGGKQPRITSKGGGGSGPTGPDPEAQKRERATQ